MARQGQFQVILLANLAEANAVDLLAGEARLVSNPRYVSFYDPAAGKVVLLAEVKDALGQLIAPNVVLYDDCFEGIQGAIRYTYTRWGFEQDILLYESADPHAAGLNPETTLLEIYTEFSASPQPRKTVRPLASGLEDELLEFEGVQIGSGKAFDLLAEGNLAEAVGVSKTWLRLDQRQFLIESVPYLEVKPWLEKLPARPQAKAAPREQAARAAVSETADPGSAAGARPAAGAAVAGKVFARREEMIAGLRAAAAGRRQRGGGRPAIEVAAAGRFGREARPGVVIDYVTLNSSQTNYVFKADTTYYVTGAVNLYGSGNVLEGGAVLKFNSGGGAALNVYGTLNCQSGPYRPVIFTAKDDTSVGETISGANTNNLSTTYYANPALYFDGASSDVRHVRIAHAQQGIRYNYFGTHTVSHAQLVRCQKALLPYYATVYARNVLVHNAGAVFDSATHPLVAHCEHLTVHGATYLASAGASGSALRATNGVFASVTSLQPNSNVSFDGLKNGFHSAPSFGSLPITANGPPFAAVGAGFHYLAAGSNWRDAGTTSINTTLLADLTKRTTSAPLVLSSDFSAPTTLAPQAARDSDTPDLGYHYDPLDYCWSGLNLSNAVLTLTNGVAVANYGIKGTLLRNGAQFVSEGTPTELNRLTRYTTVQEQPLTWGSTGSTIALLDFNGPASPLPQVRLRFTALGRERGRHGRLCRRHQRQRGR